MVSFDRAKNSASTQFAEQLSLFVEERLCVETSGEYSCADDIVMMQY